MPQYLSNNVKGYKQKDIPFTMVSVTEETERLAIFLPGAGYTAKAPLFHYASSLFLDESMDVLEVNYPYHDEFYRDFTWEELEKTVNHDVHAVLEHVLSAKPYRQFVFLAKSIGTLCMDSVLKREDVQDAKVIWVTPLLKEEKVLNALIHNEYPGLCIIGDKDPNYTPEGLERIRRDTLVETRVIPNMNHSLEHEGHVLDSIDMLKRIMKDLKEFM